MEEILHTSATSMAVVVTRLDEDNGRSEG